MPGGRRRRGGGHRREARQRLTIEVVDEDGLDGVVAIFADGVRAGAGGVDPSGAVAVDEAEDALGTAEPIEGPVAQQGVDEQRAGGTDLDGAGATGSGSRAGPLDVIEAREGICFVVPWTRRPATSRHQRRRWRSPSWTSRKARPARALRLT